MSWGVGWGKSHKMIINPSFFVLALKKKKKKKRALRTQRPSWGRSEACLPLPSLVSGNKSLLCHKPNPLSECGSASRAHQPFARLPKGWCHGSLNSRTEEPEQKPLQVTGVPSFILLEPDPKNNTTLKRFQFSCSVVSDSATHGLQHARLPIPLPTLRACSNSCPRVGDAIQPSHQAEAKK